MRNVRMPAATDRSALRRLRAAGELSRDGRGRFLAAPAILHYGFRPFFFLAALHAVLAIPLWLWMYRSGGSPSGPFSGTEWHAHEMLFGYLAAVIAGFILTAVPNWTGRLPLSGRPLAGLVALWLLGRAACLMPADPYAVMALDLAFPIALAAAVWREVTAGRNWRNAPIAAMLTLFGIANATHHAEAFGLVPDDLGIRLALGVVTMLIALIGGRIVPSFTRNLLVRQEGARLPASFGRLDKAAMLATVAAMVLWVVQPETALTGLALAVAGALLAMRLGRWRGSSTWREPILLILHVGYAWLAVSVALLGLAALSPVVPESAALHALTAGTVGTMTLAVMTRASLGHAGRAIAADRWTIAIYGLVTLGALLRVAAPFAGDGYLPILVSGGMLWSLAFLFFAARYGPILFSARRAE